MKRKGAKDSADLRNQGSKLASKFAFEGHIEALTFEAADDDHDEVPVGVEFGSVCHSVIDFLHSKKKIKKINNSQTKGKSYQMIGIMGLV